MHAMRETKISTATHSSHCIHRKTGRRPRRTRRRRQRTRGGTQRRLKCLRTSTTGGMKHDAHRFRGEARDTLGRFGATCDVVLYGHIVWSRCSMVSALYTKPNPIIRDECQTRREGPPTEVRKASKIIVARPGEV